MIGLQEFADRVDGIGAGLRIAGPVRKEHAIGLQCQHFGRRRLCRHHGDATARIGQQPQDVALDAEIVGHHMQALLRPQTGPAWLAPDRAIIPLVALAGGHDLGQIHACKAGETAGRMHGGVRIDIVAGHDAAGLRTLLAQQAGELAGVDVGDGHHAAALEVLAQRQRGAPVAGEQRQVANHKTCRSNQRRFLIFRRGAGIPDVRVSQGDYLSGVGRIGKNFLIARHRRIEDHFAGRIPFCSDGDAVENGSICQSQHGAHTHSPTSACSWRLLIGIN